MGVGGSLSEIKVTPHTRVVWGIDPAHSWQGDNEANNLNTLGYEWLLATLEHVLITMTDLQLRLVAIDAMNQWARYELDRQEPGAFIKSSKFSQGSRMRRSPGEKPDVYVNWLEVEAFIKAYPQPVKELLLRKYGRAHSLYGKAIDLVADFNKAFRDYLRPFIECEEIEEEETDED